MIRSVLVFLAICVYGASLHTSGINDDLKKLIASINPGCIKTQLPTLVHIGVGHSGSTLLANYMNEHPELSFGLMKEHNYLWNYFGEKSFFLQGYKNQFPMNCSKKVAFDSSPRILFLGLESDSEMKNDPISLRYGIGVGALRALKDLLGPKTRFLVMFRDPVPWAMSNGVAAVLDWSDVRNVTAYQQRLKRHNIMDILTGKYGTPIRQLASQTLLTGSFANRSCYADSLENWLKVFPRKNFLFLSSDDFFQNAQATLDQVADFAGVSHSQIRKDSSPDAGRRRDSRKPKWDVYRRFHENSKSRDCKQRLEKMTGLNFRWGTIEDFHRQQLD